MTAAINPVGSFAYQAQTLEGQSVSGTIDAADAAQAQRLLTGMRLRVLQVEPTTAPPPRAKALRSEDFIAFNQQFAALAAAGMPIEQGLRLIAQDMRRSRLASTVSALASELERGTPIEQAFEKFEDRFPPLYSRLVGAGVKSGNLPGLLLNLGRHLDLIQRLRAALWRAAAYPIMVLIGVAMIVLFLSVFVIPKFAMIFRDFGTKLPALTQLMLDLAPLGPRIIAGAVILVAILLIAAALLKRTSAGRALLERLLLPLPLIGPILRYNLLARWCDAVGLGVGAGLDLPRAIDLADDAVASPLLRHDGEELRAALLAGKPLDSAQHTRLLPATVVAAMALGADQHDLPAALASLSDMYQSQSRLRLSLLPGILTPILLFLVAGIIGMIILALFLPMISLIQNISG